MSLLEYIDKGGIIVYILIFLNIIGFTIILWKFFTIPRKNAIIEKIRTKIDSTHTKTLEIQIEYEIKKLEKRSYLCKKMSATYV